MVDRWAAVHDHQQAGGCRTLRGRLVPDSELQPDRAGADLNRLVDVRTGAVRGAKDVPRSGTVASPWIVVSRG